MILSSDENGLFRVAGLDDGTYYLQEIKAPTGYNLLKDDVELAISAGTENDQNWSGQPNDALKAIRLTVDNGKIEDGNVQEGSVKATIKNSKGSVLPSTGGRGTRVIYLLGAILAIGAGTLLVARKRMAA